MKWCYWWLCCCALIFEVILCSHISSKGRLFEREKGQTVDLPCNIEDLDYETAVIWKKSHEVIFVDESKSIDDQRFAINRVNNNFTLTITNLEPFDTSNYSCIVTTEPKQWITYTVQVNVPPTISISPDFKQYIVKTGDSTVMKCVSSGNPIPKVTWSRENGHMPSRATVSDGSLRIFNLSVSDTGKYVCKAFNKVADAYSSINLIVQAAPWATTDYLYLPVELDQKVNISCKYDGEPSPEVTWFFNAFIINDATDEKFKRITRYAVRHSNYSETIIQIENINEDHFGDYTCRISNNHGTVEKVVHVSGRPGPPKIKLSGQKLSWEIESVNPIIMYKIKYRTAQDDNWQDSIEVRAQKEDQHGNVWSRSYELPMNKFKSGNDYEIQVQARNSLGWGSLARSYAILKVPSEPTKAGPPSSAPSLLFSTKSVLQLCSTFMLYALCRLL
uniref:Lachesin n=1 Tax=Syphacia muris TaxID=451379 RepID=A0A0N5ALG7_9BILA